MISFIFIGRCVKGKYAWFFVYSRIIIIGGVEARRAVSAGRLGVGVLGQDGADARRAGAKRHRPPVRARFEFAETRVLQLRGYVIGRYSRGPCVVISYF